MPISVNTLNKALRIMGCDTGPSGDHCAQGLRSTASTLLNEEGAFDGDEVKAQLADDTEKKAPAERGGATSTALWNCIRRGLGIAPLLPGLLRLNRWKRLPSY